MAILSLIFLCRSRSAMTISYLLLAHWLTYEERITLTLIFIIIINDGLTFSCFQPVTSVSFFVLENSFIFYFPGDYSELLN